MAGIASASSQANLIGTVVEGDWIAGLVEFLAEQPTIEALRLNPKAQTLQLAAKEDFHEEGLRPFLETVLLELEAEYATNGASKDPLANPFRGNVRIAQLGGGELLLEKAPVCKTAGLRQWRNFSWPDPDKLEHQSRDEWETLAVQAGFCGVTLIAGWLLERNLDATWPSRVCYVASLVSGGWDAAKEALEKIRQKVLDIHFLMLCVASGAAAIGAWEEGALLLFLFSTSGALEHYALHRTHREINALTKAAPKMARVQLPDGQTEQRPVSIVHPGDTLVMRPDELFPVDGTVLEGESAADEANLTGESVPVTKNKGSSVSSGTLNLWGLLTVRVDRMAAESSLQKIINLIQNAQQMRAPSERFTDRFGTHYTYLVLGLTFVMFFIWWLVFHRPPFVSTEAYPSAFYRAMTLLVVMSPCALALSVPSAILSAIAWGARHGILFRGGAAIEKFAEVEVLCMDKTGTLTEGALHVASVESFPAGQEREVGRLAYALDSQSNHPISRAVHAYGVVQGLPDSKVEGFQRITGAGLRGLVDGELCYVGRRELIEQGEFSKWLQKLPDTPLGYSEVWVLSPKVVGRILLLDTIRQNAASVLAKLREEGLQVVMLTGDRTAAAEAVAKPLGLTEVRAGLKPEDKVNAVAAFSRAGKKVAMVGDGVNDAPSLAAAYVSIAMGARGSDAALEQSDVVLMKDDISRLATARDLSLRARMVIRQNLVISLGAIVLASLASLGGYLQLTTGVMAHEGSTVIVCLNSLRLLLRRDKGA